MIIHLLPLFFRQFLRKLLRLFIPHKLTIHFYEMLGSYYVIWDTARSDGYYDMYHAIEIGYMEHSHFSERTIVTDNDNIQSLWKGYWKCVDLYKRGIILSPSSRARYERYYK